jgi:hypothetical protein
MAAAGATNTSLAASRFAHARASSSSSRRRSGCAEMALFSTVPIIVVVTLGALSFLIPKGLYMFLRIAWRETGIRNENHERGCCASINVCETRFRFHAEFHGRK